MTPSSFSLSHLLVVVDYTEDKTIPLARAARLCKAFSAKMTVFISAHDVINQKSLDDVDDNLTTLVETAHQQVNNELTGLKAANSLENIVISWQQKPSKAVAELLKQQSFDLILKAPYQQSEFKNLFVNGLDKYFISECELPIWLVKPRLWDDSFEVLACVDMCDADFENHMMNRKILSDSDQLAKALQAQMHVVDCYYGEIGSMKIDYNSKRGFKREVSIQQQHVERLKLYINEYALDDDVLHFVEGIPNDSIPSKAAAINAEVAVIGNNEDGNIIARVFGDTAVELAKAMPCDLLVVKPEPVK